VKEIIFSVVVTEEQEKDLAQQIAQLSEKIEGVQKVVFGRNISPERAQGYTHALRATFDSRDIIQKYAIHPEHVKVATQLKSFAEAPAMCLDWEH